MKKQVDLYLLTAIFFTILAAFLRFYKLDFQSLWTDELYSLSLINKSLRSIIRICLNSDPNPPLYYIFLWMWTKVFGGGAYACRALSALFGILGVISIYMLGKKLFSKATGIIALAILSVNIYHIYYSQEARSYAMAFLLSILSFLFFIRLHQDPDLKSCLLYTSFTALLIYTHYFGLFILISQFCYILFTLSRDKQTLLLIRYYSLSGIFLFVLYIPWIPAVLRLNKLQTFWTAKPKTDFFIQYFKEYLGSEPFLIVLFSALLIIYLISNGSKYPFIQDKILLMSWLSITLFLPYLLSFYHPAPLVQRYAIVILPAIMLMASRALAFVKERQFRAFLIGAIVIMSLMNIFFTRGNYYQKIQKEQWRETTQYIIARDPHKFYPTYAYPAYCSRGFYYYFDSIFGQKRDIQSLHSNGVPIEEIYQNIKSGKASGVWILEAHEFLNERLRFLFEERLIKKYLANFFGSRATLYVSPWNYQVTHEMADIPLSSLVVDGIVEERQPRCIHFLDKARFKTPELFFQKGRYRVVIAGKCSEGSARNIWARLYTIGHTEKTAVLLDQNVWGREIILEFSKDTKCSIFLDFDSVNSKKNGAGFDIELNAIKIQRKESLSEFLRGRKETFKNSTLIISVQDEAKQSLNGASLGVLDEIGLRKAKNMSANDSYIAFIRNGILIHEEVGDRKLTFFKGDIEIVSAGKPYGNVSSIIINGINYSKNRRGINIVIMDRDGLESYNIDTHIDTENLLNGG